MVDTTLKPYTFKLIEGNVYINTQIYDSKSRSWSTTSSRLLKAAKKSRLHIFEYTCICNNGNVYISLGRHMILKYSMEDDLWTKLAFPKAKWVNENNPVPDNTLGVWEGRIFTVRENYKKRRIVVWELVDSEKQEWVEYACSTTKEYGWLWKCDFGNNGPSIYEEMCMRSLGFRDGYLLVCYWRWLSGHADALVMFKMATKTWQKVRLPMGTVAIDEQEPVPGEKFRECEDEDEDEDESEEDEEESDEEESDEEESDDEDSDED